MIIRESGIHFVYRFFVVSNQKPLDENHKKMYNITIKQIVSNHQKESRTLVEWI